MRHRPITVTVCLLAAAFFFTPAIAWVAGERAEPIENRPLSGFPSFGRGFDIFDPLTRWTTDHLPLRSTAIRANTRLTERLFDETPSRVALGGPVGVGRSGKLAGQSAQKGEPRTQPVAKGRNGWLYLRQEFTLACAPEVPMDLILSRMRRLHRIIDKSGRRLIFLVAPDKSGFELGALPADYPDRECADRAHRARIAALRRLDLPGFVDIAASLSAQRRRQGRPIYLPTDTHWTSLGSSLAAEGVAAEIDRKLIAGTQIVATGTETFVGDLSTLSGDPRKSTTHGVVIKRRGIRPPRTSDPELFPGGPVVRELRHTSPGSASLYPHRTVLYGDSFSRETLLRGLGTFFADLTRPPELGVAQGAHRLPADEQLLIDLIEKSRLMIYEVSERNFWGIQRANLLRLGLLDRIEAALNAP